MSVVYLLLKLGYLVSLLFTSPIVILFNIGNILYVVGYSLRDILWLRILTVIASLCLMPYYCFLEEILWAPIFWTSAFILINLYQITALILERRPVFLDEKELHLYQTIFQTLRPREFASLLKVADWKEIPAGDEMIAEGKPVSELMLITSGRSTVESGRRKLAEISTGQFVGEMAFLTEEVASARVFANITTRVLSWPVDQLQKLLNDSPELHVKVQSILGTDLAAKLRKDGVTPGHPSLMFSAIESGN